MAGEEKLQEILSHIPLEDFDTDPSQPRDLWVSNVLRRVIVTLFAESAGALVRLAATTSKELTTHDADLLAAVTDLLFDDDNNLMVSGKARIPREMETYTGDAADAWSGYQALDDESQVMTFIVTTNPCWFTLKDPDGNAMSDFWLPADTGISLDIRASAFRFKNYTGGSNATYQVLSTFAEAD